MILCNIMSLSRSFAIHERSFVYTFSEYLQVRGALETLLHALTTDDLGLEEPGQVQAGSVNSELLAREPASIALLLSLLVCT